MAVLKPVAVLGDDLERTLAGSRAQRNLSTPGAESVITGKLVPGFGSRLIHQRKDRSAQDPFAARTPQLKTFHSCAVKPAPHSAGDEF